MKSKLIVLLKFLPLLFLIGLFVFNLFNYGVLDDPGKVLYKHYCADCHGENGEGIKQLIPPLKNSDMALTHFDSIACWIKNGMSHQITVNGKVYEQTMYPIKINAVETANVINYISKEFLQSDKLTTSAKVTEQFKKCTSD